MVLAFAAMVWLMWGAMMARSDAQPPSQPPPMNGLRHEQRFKIQQEVGAVLDDFHDAASKADFDRYFKHWSAASVFLGTDATERWVGQEFRDFAKPHFDKAKGWAYRSHDRHIEVAPGNEAAFFDELLDNERLGLCRGSGVLQKMEGQWWIMQYNLSIPVPNDLAERVAGLINQGPPKVPEGERKHQE
jgi:hypothetical protein